MEVPFLAVGSTALRIFGNQGRVDDIHVDGKALRTQVFLGNRQIIKARLDPGPRHHVDSDCAGINPNLGPQGLGFFWIVIIFGHCRAGIRRAIIEAVAHGAQPLEDTVHIGLAVDRVEEGLFGFRVAPQTVFGKIIHLQPIPLGVVFGDDYINRRFPFQPANLGQLEWIDEINFSALQLHDRYFWCGNLQEEALGTDGAAPIVLVALILNKLIGLVLDKFVGAGANGRGVPIFCRAAVHLLWV